MNCFELIVSLAQIETLAEEMIALVLILFSFHCLCQTHVKPSILQCLVKRCRLSSLSCQTSPCVVKSSHRVLMLSLIKVVQQFVNIKS